MIVTSFVIAKKNQKRGWRWATNRVPWRRLQQVCRYSRTGYRSDSRTVREFVPITAAKRDAQPRPFLAPAYNEANARPIAADSALLEAFEALTSEVRVLGSMVTVVHQRRGAAGSKLIQPPEDQQQPRSARRRQTDRTDTPA